MAAVGHRSYRLNIKHIGSKYEGFEQSIKEPLPQAQLQYTNASVPENSKENLSWDGTWLGSKLPVINFTFTLLDFPSAKESCTTPFLQSSKHRSHMKIRKKPYII